MVRVRRQTHVKALDEALEGGIPEGHIVLITGAPGTMKSSLAFSILYHNALSEGHKGLYLTLEQNKASLVEHLEAMGMDDPKGYEGVSIFDMATLRKNLAFMAEGSWITLFRGYIRSLTDSDAYDFLVIDSLNVLETMANFEARRSGLFYLFEWLRDLDVTTLIIAEALGDVFTPGKESDESYLADGVIHLSLYPISDLEVQRRLRFVKLRATKHEVASFALVWSGKTFEVTRPVSVGRPARAEQL